MNFTINNSSCIGWSNPAGINIRPVITSLSGYYSPAGATTLVVIFGNNFRNFSKIRFGTFTPNTIFISSEQIQFYVPIAATFGIYPIQVFNDAFASNVVIYNLDNASGYWYLNLNNQRINNTNIGGVVIDTPSNPSLFGPSLISLADKNYPAISIQTDVSGSTWPVYLNFIPQVTAKQYNDSVQEGDSLILNYQDVSGNFTAINLTFWDNTSTPSGVRIAPTETTISGDLTVTGTIFCNSVIPIPSDYRIKENITLLDHTYNIDDLHPIKYYNTKSKNEEIGFLAHEVQEKFPFLVHGDKDGENLQRLNYIGLIGILVKEVQDLKNEVKLLKSQIHS
jgi:hypothetical protein